jgi:tetratricopeptide (TPR) repeat protein
MGWVFLLLLGGAAMAGTVLLGTARALWSSVGAALMLGGAGYALQGSPTLPASPAQAAAQAGEDDPGLAILRDELFGRFTADNAYLIAADALSRSGDTRAAASLLIGGLNAMPRSVSLWTALGTTLARHDGDQVSPAALFAFQQAARLAPQHPAPPFFLGLAQVRAGNLAAARAPWVRALALAPAGAPYRAPIAERLALLDRYLALTGGGPR